MAWDLDLGDAAKFNLFVQQNGTLATADSQGKIAIGGEASIDDFEVGVMQGSQGGNTVLHVGGNLTVAGSQNIKGDAEVAGIVTVSGGDPLIYGGQFKTGKSIDFAATFAHLLQLSERLTQVAIKGTAQSEWSELRLSGNDVIDSNGFFVADVSGHDFVNATMLKGDFAATDTVVLNVGGTDIDLDSLDLAWDFRPPHGQIIYNFYEATNISMDIGAIKGVLLAPKADFSFTQGLITGTVIAKSFSSDADAQLNFTSSFVPVTSKVPVTEVPAPSTLLLLLGALMVLIRRQRA